MEPLSAVASIGSLADITIRASVVLYDRFRKLKNAPQNMQSLLSELKSFTTEVTAFGNEFKSSPFAVEDNIALPEVASIVQDCRSELAMLQCIADAAAPAPSDGWFVWGKRRAILSFDCRKVDEACKQLERHRSALRTALALVGARTDIILRSQLSETRKEIASAQSKTELDLRDARQEIASCSRNIEDIGVSFEQFATEVKSFGAVHGQRLAKIQDVIISTDGTIRSAATSLRTVAHRTQDQIQRLDSKLDARNSEIMRRVSQTSLGTARKSDRHFRSLEQTIISHQHELIKRLDVLTVQEEDDWSSLCPPDVEAEQLSLCLGLLKPELHKANRELALGGESRIPSKIINVLQAEMQDLLSWSYQEALHATVKPGSSSLSRRQRYNHPLNLCIQGTSVDRVEKSEGSHSETDYWLTQFYSHLDNRATPHWSYQDRGAKGRLYYGCIEYSKEEGSLPQKKRAHGRIVSIRFHPKRDICPIGVQIILTLQEFPRPSSFISRYIRPYLVMSSASKAVGCAKRNDFLGLRRLLSAREVTPFARDEAGNTLLFYAALHKNVAVYSLLLNEGADPLDCHQFYARSSRDALYWAHHANMTSVNWMNDLEKITRLTLAYGYDLCDFDVCKALARLQFNNHEFSAAIRLSLDLGFGANIRDQETLLLGLASRASSTSFDCFREAVELLVSKGADINVKDECARGMISIVINHADYYCLCQAPFRDDEQLIAGHGYNDYNYYKWLIPGHYFVLVLALLIQLGCDPNVKMSNQIPLTVSEFAAATRIRNLIWAAAVRLAGCRVEVEDGLPSLWIVTRGHQPLSKAEYYSTLQSFAYLHRRTPRCVRWR